jgi:hypothetical protein
LRTGPAVSHGGAFDADGTLLKVGLTGDGVTVAESDDVGVGLGKVKGHEDLSRGDDSGDAKFEVGYGSAAAPNGDAVMGLEVEVSGVEWVHLEPGVGDHVVEKIDFGGLGTGVPVFDSSPRVEDEAELSIRLFLEWVAWDLVEDGTTVWGRKDAVAVERFAAPLDAVGAVDLLPGEVGVVAHAIG